MHAGDAGYVAGSVACGTLAVASGSSRGVPARNQSALCQLDLRLQAPLLQVPAELPRRIPAPVLRLVPHAQRQAATDIASLPLNERSARPRRSRRRHRCWNGGGLFRSRSTLRRAMHDSLTAALRLGKCPSVLTVRSTRELRLSMALVVQVALRTGSMQEKEGTISSRCACQLAAMAGCLRPSVWGGLQEWVSSKRLAAGRRRRLSRSWQCRPSPTSQGPCCGSRG